MRLTTSTMINCRHLARFPDAAWDSIPELPKAAVSLLSADFVHSTSKVRWGVSAAETLLHCCVSSAVALAACVGNAHAWLQRLSVCSIVNVRW